jgi:hypothetical protein
VDLFEEVNKVSEMLDGNSVRVLVKLEGMRLLSVKNKVA